MDINIGAITEAINNKTDRDASNLSATGKENIVALGMPDYTAGIDITPYNSSSNQFTAPCAGFINVLFSGTNINEVNVYVNGVRVTRFGWNTSVSITGNIPIVFLSKGDKFYGTNMYSSTALPLNNFYPLKGVN